MKWTVPIGFSKPSTADPGLNLKRHDMRKKEEEAASINVVLSHLDFCCIVYLYELRIWYQFHHRCT